MLGGGEQTLEIVTTLNHIEPNATSNQVVLAWLLGSRVPVIPLVGASSVAQLDESLAAVDLELTADQRTRLDAAH